MPNISSYGKAGGKGYKKSGMSPMKKKTAGSSAKATMRRQQADLEKRRAQREAPAPSRSGIYRTPAAAAAASAAGAAGAGTKKRTSKATPASKPKRMPSMGAAAAGSGAGAAGAGSRKRKRK